MAVFHNFVSVIFQVTIHKFNFLLFTNQEQPSFSGTPEHRNRKREVSCLAWATYFLLPMLAQVCISFRDTIFSPKYLRWYLIRRNFSADKLAHLHFFEINQKPDTNGFAKIYLRFFMCAKWSTNFRTISHKFRFCAKMRENFYE